MADRLVWRVLRLWLPRGFRERRSALVLETHVALAGGPSGARGVRFWGRVAWDVLVTGLRLRLEAGRGGRGVEVARDRRGAWRPRFTGARQAVFMAVRSLRRAPLFAAGVVLILALGISSNVTIFRILDRLLLSPPEHVRSPEQVRRLYILGRSPFTGEVVHSAALAYPDYRGFTELAGLDGFAGYGDRALTLYVEGAGETVSTQMATASYFDVLGVRPAVGRFFRPDEDEVGASGVAVLGWSYWRERFRGDRSVLGREVSIGKAMYRVIGIAPRGFTGVGITPVDVWLPLHVAMAAEYEGTDWVEARSWYIMAGVARVPGSVAAAEAEATAVLRRVREGARGADPDARMVLAPLIAAKGPDASRESRVARVLAALTVLVLLLTCANVGNLYLARVVSRRRELAVQAALGVSRRGLFGQLLAEVAVVAAVAGVLAWWIGTAAAGALFRVLLPDAALPTANGPRVLGLTVGLALLTALLTGVLPALRATRVAVTGVLRGRSATRRVVLLRRGLLMVQAALSVLLLVGAGLFIRSLQRAESVDLGLDTSVLAIDVELQDGVVFGEEMGPALARLLPLIRQSGLVETAAVTSLAPFSGWWGLAVSAAEGEAIESGRTGPYVFGVSGDYFSTIGLAVERGRTLTDADAGPGAPPVVVVSERLAGRLWPGVDAVGQCLRVESGGDWSPCSTVVGIVRDYLPSIEADETPFVFYVPQGHQAVGAAGANTILARVREGATPAMVRDFVRSAAPDLRMVKVAPLSRRIEPALRAWQLGSVLLSAVGLLALMIAAAGLYGMLAFDVAQRRRELGIRAALGATSSRLIWSTVAANAGAVSAGVLVGLVASLLGGRAIEAMLFRVSAADPVVYVAACASLLVVGLAAGVLPAHSATRTDPAIPLRED